MNEPETVKIRGVMYEVLNRWTTARLRAEGMQNTAKSIEDQGSLAHLDLRRPKGLVHFFAIEFPGNRFTAPVSLGRLGGAS